MERAAAIALLRRAAVVHLATTTPDGAPIIRTVHAVVGPDAVAFHGAPKGEKTEAIGRDAVLSAEEIVAEIPSHFVDPERACPATTWYRSVQVHGRLERVDDRRDKAAILQALMERYQPEGGHAPINADSEMYRRAVNGILITRIPLDRIDGKAKLGQNRGPAEMVPIFERLWRRGRAEDVTAIETVLSARPELPRPKFLCGPSGVSLTCQPSDVAAAVRLVADEYWNVNQSVEAITRAHLGSSAWVAAHDSDGALIGTARGVSDEGKVAWIFDVAVQQSWRGSGVGDALLRLLLDHPRIRGARSVRLATRDAHRFYARFGFENADGATSHTPMVLSQR